MGDPGPEVTQGVSCRLVEVGNARRGGIGAQCTLQRMAQRLSDGIGPIEQRERTFFNKYRGNHGIHLVGTNGGHTQMKQVSGQPDPYARFGPPPNGDPTRAARVALAWAIALSLLLAWLPSAFPALAWLAWPQVLASTLAHELGHGLAALISGGAFESLRVYADGSGVASTRSSGTGLAQAWVAAGGPLGPPLAALALFIAASRAGAARAALWLIAAFLLLAMLLWVRNGFGLLWFALCALLAGIIGWRAPKSWAQAAVCLVAVQLCLSTLSRLDGLFERRARTGEGELLSDTGQLATLLGGPHWFWGALIALVSFGVMVVGVWAFLRTLRSAR